MKFKEVKEEIRRIAGIGDSKKCQEEVRELNYTLNEKPKIKRVYLGYNWHYFYEVLGYDSKGSHIIGQSYGRISDKIFKENKKEIEKFRISGKIEELKKYMTFGRDYSFYDEKEYSFSKDYDIGSRKKKGSK